MVKDIIKIFVLILTIGTFVYCNTVPQEPVIGIFTQIDEYDEPSTK